MDDEAVKGLLTDLHPLRVSKYLENTPTTKPVANYVVKITTQGPGGAAASHHELKLVDPGGDQALLGEYNGLSFELPRTFLSKIEGNFVEKPKATARTRIVFTAKFLHKPSPTGSAYPGNIYNDIYRAGN